MKSLFKKMTAIASAAIMAASATVVASAAGAAKYVRPNDNDYVGNDTFAATLGESAGTVWVNGKDTKGKVATDVGVFYKSLQISYTGMYTGGKWNVAVLDKEVGTDVAKFAEMLATGKIDSRDTSLSAGKTLATAKLKDGVITVSSGKAVEAGTAYVWLYEINNKKLVNTEAVKPVCFPVNVKVADPSIFVKKAAADTKATSKITLGASSDLSKVELLFSTKDATKAKVEEAHYTIDPDKKNKTSNVTAAIDGNKIKFTCAEIPSAKASENFILTCVESGKTAKITVNLDKGARTQDFAS